MENILIKISSKTKSSSYASVIANNIKEGNPVELRAVGAGAINQAIKAICIAKDYLTECNIKICCIPSFTDVEIDGEKKSAVKFDVVVM